MCGWMQFVDHFPSSAKLDYYKSLKQCREKTNLVFDVSIGTNVEEGMLFHMPLGKYQLFLQFHFWSSDPTVFKFCMFFKMVQLLHLFRITCDLQNQDTPNHFWVKVCSINFEPPDKDLCSACHVYPLSRGAWTKYHLYWIDLPGGWIT